MGETIRVGQESRATGARGWISSHLFKVDASPATRQIPTILGTMLAVGIAIGIPTVGVVDPLVAWPGVILVALATVFSWLINKTQLKRSIELVVPVVSLLGIGLFRAGTGGTDSFFTALLILPIVWIASEHGRRFIAIAVVSTSVVMLMPYAIALQLPGNAAQWTLGVFSPIVLGLASVVVNELSRQARDQLDATRRIAEERQSLLEDMTRSTQRIQQSEARLRTASALTSSVLNSVTEQSIIGTDLTGLIDVWNPGASSLLGLPPGEVEGKRYIFEFHLPEELEERSRMVDAAHGSTVLNPGFLAMVEPARRGKADVRNWTYQKADGTRVTVEVAVTPRSNEHGETIGYIFVAADVSHAVKLARLKDEFIGLISHELRTPLSSIMGYLELLHDDEEAPLNAEQRQYLSVAERNAQRLLHLVGDLLFTAQVDSGMFPIVQTELELRSLVAAAVESARPAASRGGIDLKLMLSETATRISGDPSRLSQALDNLISNAVKFTPRGGTVTVSLSGVITDAVLTVSDTGMGVPPGEVERLGDKFFRATTATRNAVPGAGLGLAITKAIVQAHGGRIDVQSAEGSGTTFTIALPMVGTEGGVGTTQATPAPFFSLPSSP